MVEFTVLLELFEKYGLLAVAIALLIGLGYRYVLLWLQHRFPPREVAESSDMHFIATQRPLTDHRLFSACSYWADLGIDQMPFPRRYQVRSHMYRDMLKILVRTIHRVFDANITELTKTSSSTAWQRAATHALSVTVTEYEQKFREQGIPEIVITQFREWNRTSLNYISHTIASLQDSEIADENRKKTSFLFSAVLAAMKTAFIDAERTLIGLNGQLTGKSYRGREIE